MESLRGHAITKGLKDTIDVIEKDVGKVGVAKMFLSSNISLEIV